MFIRVLAIPLFFCLAIIGCVSSTPASSPTQAPAIQPTITSPSPTVSVIEPSPAVAQVTPTPTPLPSPTSSPVPSPEPAQEATNTPAPTSTLGPAPTEDRVGLPDGYQQNFDVFYTFDRPDNKQSRVIYGNEEAHSVKPGEPFPYGSILIMETWRTKQDDDGNVILDENGHYTPDTLGGIFIMRKEQGFGEAYEHLRSGEWEYVAFRPDGTYFTPPQNTANCAFCHQRGATEVTDFVFRLNLAFEEDRYGTPPQLEQDSISISSMAFFPRSISVTAGTTLTWFNNDVTVHTASSRDDLWDSGVIPQEDGSFSHRFNTPGTFEYICNIHPAQMRATIEVTN